ncbi:MAG: UDP-2,3-diacylglucosamine diphosphatase [Flavobacteriales bacterium]|nr:UDP-2,3-diacylglucosamine diphosphatase [Flavobacteriales bacterium]
MILATGKKIYFASDFHLGAPNFEASLEREKRIVCWLNEIQHDAAEIFLVGDIFDFWFEYKRTVPRGFTRLLGKISELTDRGVPVHVFTGNHDMWIFDYLPRECGVIVYRKPIEREWNGKKFLIAHGDGLGPGDKGYKFIKKIFTNKFCQWLFARFHPNFGIWLATSLSGYSRSTTGDKDIKFLGAEKEWLVLYSKAEQKKKHFDYFIFGHRHLPMEIQICERSSYFNLGDWLTHYTYGVFNGTQMVLQKFENKGMN